ncbi:MAG: ABC transporter permease [Rhodospirillales bacterium]|nr:ABC transporter permease [Rhodospirillales bacterium]MDE2197676.1 ABC transporter permease [Rhodospirillales bacterium]
MGVWRAILWRGGVGAVFAVVLLPLVAVVWLSFFNQEIIAFPPEGYTWRWYANAWSQRQFASGFLNSLEIALIAASIGVTVGTAAAYALVRARFPGKTAIAGLLLGPLAIPGVVLGTGLYVFFVQIDNAIDFQIVATLPGLIAAHVLLTIPWTVRLVAASLQGLHPAAEEAAANLGARPWTVFRRVTLPMMRAGVVAGALFSFIQSFENLELTLLLTGPGRSTLPVEMLNYLEFRVDPTLAAVATVQIVLIGALMLITDRFVNISRVVA